MRRTIAEMRKLVKEIGKIKMNTIISALAITGAVVVGFGFGAVPGWTWVPFTGVFCAGFLYVIFSDNRKAKNKEARR